MTAADSEATVQFDPETLNPHFSYGDEKGRTHQVWLTDAVTAFNQVRATDAAGVKGTALWRLGSEDPSLWRFWGSTARSRSTSPGSRRSRPATTSCSTGTATSGGSARRPQPGRREIHLDPATRLIVGETYLTLPKTWEIDQVGARPGEIVLSFDDGPDPRFTPQILDVLKSRGAPATFFVTGLSANAHPGPPPARVRGRATRSATTATRTRTSTASATRSCSSS